MGINLGEGLLISGIIMFFFGGKKLPEFGKAFGTSIRNFKEGLHEEPEDTKKDSEKENKKI